MAKNATAPSEGHSLVIVESPAKARTISKFLGKGYTVEASIGPVSYTHLTLPTIRLV